MSVEHAYFLVYRLTNVILIDYSYSACGTHSCRMRHAPIYYYIKQKSLSVSLYFELSWPSKLVVSCPDPFHAVKIRICIHSNCITHVQLCSQSVRLWNLCKLSLSGHVVSIRMWVVSPAKFIYTYLVIDYTYTYHRYSK